MYVGNEILYIDPSCVRNSIKNNIVYKFLFGKIGEITVCRLVLIRTDYLDPFNIIRVIRLLHIVSHEIS